MKDGRTLPHSGKGNPDSLAYAGSVDDEVGVLGVWKKHSPELLGFMLNFSCHADVHDEEALAEFPSFAIDTVRAVYGQHAGAVYLNGASGDVTQIDNLSLRQDIGKPISIKIGRSIGGEAIKLLATADRGDIMFSRYSAPNCSSSAILRAQKLWRRRTDELQSMMARTPTSLPRLGS